MSYWQGMCLTRWLSLHMLTKMQLSTSKHRKQLISLLFGNFVANAETRTLQKLSNLISQDSKILDVDNPGLFVQYRRNVDERNLVKAQNALTDTKFQISHHNELK